MEQLKVEGVKITVQITLNANSDVAAELLQKEFIGAGVDGSVFDMPSLHGWGHLFVVTYSSVFDRGAGPQIAFDLEMTA